MRWIALFLISCTLFGASVDKDIAKTTKILEKQQKEIENINQLLNRSSEQILQHKEQLKQLDAKKGILEKELSSLEGTKKKNVQTLGDLSHQKERLLSNQKSVEERLVKMIAQQLSFSLVFDKGELADEKDLLKQFTFQNVKLISTTDIKNLKQEYLTKQREILSLEGKLNIVKSSIQNVTQKEQTLEKIQKEKVGAIDKLDKASKAYRGKLARLIQSQEAARGALERLNIVKKRSQTRVATSRRGGMRLPDVKASDDDDTKTIKNYGSSYQDLPSAHYNGGKVDAPVANARVVKSFGSYIDPVYNIKIHNDYVILRSSGSDVVVKSVMPGRVVYAKNVASLGLVVIVEHSGGLATIYAHLGKIAPGIRAGSHVSGGDIVGRVDQEVMFEVTKNGVPVNPLDLIDLN
jgi:septal ring factor EnvC (AmiA/AmiB activator)